MHENLNAVLWMQSSGEYSAITRQTFALAKSALEMVLNDRSITAALEQTGDYQHLPPAIIIDVDETILDSSPFAAWLIKNDIPYNPSDWNRWVEMACAEAIPGAVSFVQYAVSLGVVVYYISGRKTSDRDATNRNLLASDCPLEFGSETVLMAGDEEPEKGKHSLRVKIAEHHRILMILGDDLADFTPDVVGMDYKKRKTIAEKYNDYWGTRWIILPNPSYGGWEQAFSHSNNKGRAGILEAME